MVIDKESRKIVSVSTKALELFGRPRDSLVDNHLKALLPDAPSSFNVGKRYALHAAGPKGSIPLQVTAADLGRHTHSIDGETVSAEYVSLRLHDTRGDVQTALTTELSSVLVEMTPDAIITIDAVGTILTFNRAAEDIFDFTFEQVKGKNIKILMPDNVGARHDKYLSDYQRSRVKKAIDNTRIVKAERKNGDEFDAEISVKEIIDPITKQCTFVGYLRDLEGHLRKASTSTSSSHRRF